MISKWNIITAAHCVVDNQNRKVSPSQIKVFLGAHSSKNLPQASKVASFQINYNPKDPSVDLAIIELESPISYSKTIAPICMMSGIGLNFTNGKLVTAGWGLTREGDKIPEYPSRLTLDHIPSKYIFLSVNQINISNTLLAAGECQEKYNYFAKLHRQTPIKITDRLICAINRATGGDSCEGDSGGGLIYKNPQDGRYYLIGTVAGSVSECGQAHHPPGGYTNLAYHQDFIKKYTRLDCSSSAKSVQSSLPSSAQSTQQKTSQTTSSSIKYQKSSRSGIDSYDSDMELAEVIELMLYD